MMTHRRAAAYLLTLALLIVGIAPSSAEGSGVRCSRPTQDAPAAAPSPERSTAIVAASRSASNWQITTLPSPADQGTFSSIAVDRDGIPHISFLDQTEDNEAVRYARLEGQTWEESLVETLPDLFWANTSLVLGDDDQPQIAYPYPDPCRIRHAAWSGSAWQLVSDLDTGGCPEYVNLALDGAGALCISYRQWERRGQTQIQVMCREGDEWSTASVVDTVSQTTPEELALYHALVLESDGTPHLGYYRQTTDTTKAELWYATRSDGSWDRTVVDEGPGVGSYASLALDSQNHPAISYYDHVDGDLRYARWDGSRWISETVDSDGDVGAHTSLALDESDHPHVSYYDATNQDLKYATWDGSRWISETVASAGAVGQWTSLALDGLGNPHVSAYDATNGDLLYATRDTSPKADFSAKPTSGPAPLMVYFTNRSSGDYDACAWSFGDGGTSSDCADPSHVYASAGAYTVTLTISGPRGSDTLTRTNLITTYQPVQADFSAQPISGPAPLTVEFTNRSSGDYDACAWSFGDGGTSSDCADPSHVYASAGAYTVTLSVSGPGGSDVRTRPAYVTVRSTVYLPVLARGG
jgi:PKD repeat protein